MAKNTATDSIKVTIQGKRLVIDLPLEAATLSASGKSYVIASTRGNMTTDAKIDGKPIVIGVNAYFRA